MDAKEFGEYLKGIRKTKKMTIRQLELYSGVSNAYISQLERGIRGIPSPDILQKLSKPLGVDYEELMRNAEYIEDNESVTLINKLLRSLSGDTELDQYIRELTGESVDFDEILNEATLADKLDMFMAATRNFRDVYIEEKVDGTKDIMFGKRPEDKYDLDDDTIIDKLPLFYKGMELNSQEKAEFIAIARAIFDARRGQK